MTDDAPTCHPEEECCDCGYCILCDHCTDCGECGCPGDGECEE